MGEQMQFLGVTAYLRYPDGDAAATWLTRVLGFGPVDPQRVVRNSNGGWRSEERRVGKEC